MTMRDFGPVLPRYIMTRYCAEYFVPLYPVQSVAYRTSEDRCEIEPRVVAVYHPNGIRYPNGDAEFEYAGVRIIP